MGKAVYSRNTGQAKQRPEREVQRDFLDIRINRCADMRPILSTVIPCCAKELGFSCCLKILRRCAAQDDGMRSCFVSYMPAHGCIVDLERYYAEFGKRPDVRSSACQQSGKVTLLSFFRRRYLKNLRFLQPFARARQEFLRNSCENLRNLNRRGFQPLVSVDSFGSLFAATGSAHLSHRTCR